MLSSPEITSPVRAPNPLLIETPHGKGWAPTVIREILRNPIYRGERIWNRSYSVKDHEMGRRRRFERPENGEDRRYNAV